MINIMGARLAQNTVKYLYIIFDVLAAALFDALKDSAVLYGLYTDFSNLYQSVLSVLSVLSVPLG